MTAEDLHAAQCQPPPFSEPLPDSEISAQLPARRVPVREAKLLVHGMMLSYIHIDGATAALRWGIVFQCAAPLSCFAHCLIREICGPL